MNHILRIIARMLPAPWLIKLSRWDDDDGAPLNVWADELCRRDGFGI